MKKLFSILALSVFALSCTKNKDNTPTQKATSKERMINDSVLFVNGLFSVPIDIDGDSVNDVSIFINSIQWQSWSEDSTAIIPLVAGVQTPQKTMSVYFSLDSLRCPISSGDTITFFNWKMCNDSDPKLNRTESKTFAKLNNNDTIAYSDLTKTLLISYSYSSYTNGPCGQTGTSYYYGNGIGKNGIIQLKKAGKRYNLKLSKDVPYFIVHSITALD